MYGMYGMYGPVSLSALCAVVCFCLHCAVQVHVLFAHVALHITYLQMQLIHASVLLGSASPLHLSNCTVLFLFQFFF